jgi:hypothetical protein
MKMLKAGKTNLKASLILGTNADEGTDFVGYDSTGTLTPPVPINLTKVRRVRLLVTRDPILSDL